MVLRSLVTLEKAVTEVGRESVESRSKERFQDDYG